MFNLNRITIKSRLLVGFSSIILFVIFTAAVSFSGLFFIVDEISSMFDVSARMEQHSHLILTNLTKCRQYEKDIFINISSNDKVIDYYQKWTKNYQAVYEELTALTGLQNSQEDYQIAEKMKKLMDSYTAGFNLVYSKIQSGEITTAQNANKEMNRYKDSIRELADISEKLSKDAANSMNSIQYQIIKNRNATLSIIGILVFLSFATAIIIATIVSRSILRPLYKTVSISQRIAAGDLGVKIKIQGKDEISDLLEAQKTITEKFRDIITDLQIMIEQMRVSTKEMSTTTDSFADSIQGQAATAEEITATIEELTAGIEGIAGHATVQTERMDNLNDKLTQLAAITNDMDIKIHDTAVESGTISSMAKTGEKTLNQMGDIMNRIIESSKKMTEIVEIITGISEQINLLSLNAAIEAARAGDSGRGFAVVADEISKLADQTGESIKSIDSLIRISTEEISRGMENSSQTINTITSIIDKIGTISIKINAITGLMKDQVTMQDTVGEESQTVKRHSDEIKTATEEQKIATTELSRSIADINELIQTNASSAEELAGSTGFIAEASISIKKKISYFKL